LAWESRHLQVEGEEFGKVVGVQEKTAICMGEGKRRRVEGRGHDRDLVQKPRGLQLIKTKELEVYGVYAGPPGREQENEPQTAGMKEGSPEVASRVNKGWHTKEKGPPKGRHSGEAEQSGSRFTGLAEAESGRGAGCGEDHMKPAQRS
ncbi:hypothetical protein GOP47_0021220, partial [Adiantum capillus-veneris]